MNIFDYLFEETRDLKKDFVLGPKETISFRILYENSLKVASYLKMNVGEGKNIVLISSNTVFFIVTYLGILKSGNICVPLNLEIEQENLDFVLKTTKCKTIFTTNRSPFKAQLDEVLNCIDEDFLKVIIDHQNTEIFDFDFEKNSLAEIVFTSGSTGNPRGVMLSHHNVISNTDSIIEYLNLSSRDIVAVVLPFFYCYGLSLLHSHLRVGGSLTLNNNFMFLGSFIKDLKTYKCTGFAGVPSHYQILLKKSHTFKNTKFPDLRYVTQAGGKLHTVFIIEFITAFPEIDFFIMYGQTEATARLSYLPPRMLREKMGAIGKGIPGVRLKVINKECGIAQIDEEGELLAEGDNIMLGYYKDPEGTSNAIKNGWLYTGDIAKMDQDGFIYLMGRKKEIVKVGGKRVSLKEIEEVIVSISEVIDCTISSVYDRILGEVIHATIVIHDKIDQDQMRDNVLLICSQRLCSYKIPKYIVFENSIAMNATGKKVKQYAIPHS